MPTKADPLARAKFLREMRQEHKAQSPLGEYLNSLRADGEEGARMAEFLEADLMEVFTSEEGLRILKLFEKAVLFRASPNGANDGALRELNAVRNFVLEIRRYVANG